MNQQLNRIGVLMKKSKRLLPLLLTMILTSPLSALAQDSYQYIAGGAYWNTDSDGNIESTAILGAFQIYTTPISYLDGPYAEAGFLNRQPSLLVSFGSVEYDADFGAVTPSIDGTILGAGFEYASKDTPFAFGVLYNQAEADDTVINTKLEINYDVLQLRLGYYLTNKSLIRFEYTQTEVEFLGNGTAISNSEADSYSLSFRNLSYLARNQFLGYTIGAAYIDNNADEQNTEFSLSADYYFARTTSLGAEFTLNSGDDISLEGTTININFGVFFTPMASLNFEYEQFSADEANNDDETIRLEFAVRF